METEDNQDNKAPTLASPSLPPPNGQSSMHVGITQESNKDLLRIEKIDEDARRQKMYQPFLIKEHKTERIGPSPLLDRVKNFLPLMSAANAELDKKIKRDGKEAVNIENLTSDNSPHVAMDLFVPGVVADEFYKGKGIGGDGDDDVESMSSSSSSSSSSSDDDDDDSSDSEEEYYDEQNERILKMKIPNAGTRPQFDGIFHTKPKIKEIK